MNQPMPQQPQQQPPSTGAALADQMAPPPASTHGGIIQDPDKLARLEAQLARQEPSRPLQTVQSDTPVTDSLLTRFGNAFDERVTSMADTFADASGLSAREDAILAGQDPNLAAPKQGAFQTGVQMLGDAAGLVYDVAGDTISYGAEEAFRLLPQETQADAKAALKSVMESPLGKAGLQAWQAGDTAWKKFEQAYPQEAKTLSRGLNLVPMARTVKGATNLRVPTELTPMRIERVGLRNQLKPPSGRDKDLYNIVVPEKAKSQKIEDLKRGGTTSPGFTGSQKLIPSDEEWRVIDELKKIPAVNGQKTYTHNFNIVLDELNKTNEQARRAAAGTKGGISWQNLENGIEQRIAQVRAADAVTFGVKGKKGKNLEEELVEQFYKYVDLNGNSFEGILRSRQDFDNYVLNKLQTGTYSGRKANVATEVHKAVRAVANDFVKENVPGAGPMLAKQHNLFKALDGIAPSAADEAASAVGRILQQLNMHMPTTALAQASTLTSPLVLASTGLALAVSPALFAYKFGLKRGIKNAKVQGVAGRINYTLRDVVNEGKKAMKLIKDPQNRKQLGQDIQALTVMINSLENAELPADYGDESL